MRALLVLCLAGTAHAELPTIESEFPPALAIVSDTWGMRVEHVAVAIRSAPDPTFVTLTVAGRNGVIGLDVPAGTKIVGLGVDGPDGRAWGRAQPAKHARAQHVANGGSLLAWTSTSADVDHLRIEVNAPAQVEVALHLPPLQRLAITTERRAALVVDVAGEPVATPRKHAVLVELADIAGTTGELAMPHANVNIALVAAPSSASDFLPHPAIVHPLGPRSQPDLDKAMIRRRLKWFRPRLRECYVHEAQWDGANNIKPLAGSALLSFSISDGSVEWARTSNTDLPTKVTDCLVAEALTWTFPRADGTVHVNYPLTFHTW